MRIPVAGAMSAVELFMERDWTDGLPILPPTPARVEAMLAGADLAPEHVLGYVPERRRQVTAQKAAINAVMAGCRPEYFPLVAALVEAVCEPAFGVHGPTATTAGTAILSIVNGPIRHELGINSGANLFGPGNRANATVGRALRLILRNVCAATPAGFDRACLSHPGKFTYCIGELEELSDWTPLHVQRGFPREASTVTVFAADGPNQIASHVARDPETLLEAVADRMRALGTMNLREGDGEAVLVVGPEHLEILRGALWSKEQVQRYLWERARRSIADLKRGGLRTGEVVPGDEERFVYVTAAPEHLLTVMAGGTAGRWSSFIPGWTGRLSSLAVTKEITRSPRFVPWPEDEAVTEVLDPTEGPMAEQTRLAARRPLAGLTVGLLSNGKPNADRALDVLADHLRLEHGVTDFYRITKQATYRPAPPEVLDLLVERCGAVITGVGD